jgi:hypothetical protein
MRDEPDPQRCRRGRDIAVVRARPIEHRADLGCLTPPCTFKTGWIPRRDKPAVAGDGDRAEVEGFEIPQH